MKKMIIIAILITIVGCSAVALKINQIKDKASQEVKIESINDDKVEENAMKQEATFKSNTQNLNVRERNFIYIKYSMALLAVLFLVVYIYELVYSRL